MVLTTLRHSEYRFVYELVDSGLGCVVKAVYNNILFIFSDPCQLSYSKSLFL